VSRRPSACGASATARKVFLSPDYQAGTRDLGLGNRTLIPNAWPLTPAPCVAGTFHKNGSSPRQLRSISADLSRFDPASNLP